MVIVAIVINLVISAICLYLAWRLWKIGQGVDRAANAVLRADRVVYNVLHKSPRAIARAYQGTHNLRQRYQQLQHQVKALRKLLAIISFLGQFRWQSWSSFSHSGRGAKKV